MLFAKLVLLRFKVVLVLLEPLDLLLMLTLCSLRALNFPLDLTDLRLARVYIILMVFDQAF